MKLATVIADDSRKVVVEILPGQTRYRVVASLQGPPLQSMLDLIRGQESTGGRCELDKGSRAINGELAAVRLAPPLFPARDIICVGKNYRLHAAEFSRSGYDRSDANGADAVPDAPVIFTKFASCAVGDREVVRYPAGVSTSVDYEAELAVVIGKQCRGVKKAEALDHVFGYTIVNDLTARDLQARHKQWFLGKSLDGFCPIGPWIVTRDEIDAAALDIRCWVNGELRQSANTRDLIFDVSTLIETLSAGITLMPGDVIATGTPAGVGIGFDPPKFLEPGDEIEIEIEHIGRLRNRIA